MARSQISLTGPFFTRDPVKTWRKNVKDLMADIAEQGEADVRQQWPVKTGAGRAGTHGFVREINAEPVAVVAAMHVYPWPAGGGAKQYRGGKIERRRHMFRNTKGRIGKRVKIDLLKGLV